MLIDADFEHMAFFYVCFRLVYYVLPLCIDVDVHFIAYSVV